jgi:transitional endoplasmic reticulum ATPase
MRFPHLGAGAEAGEGEGAAPTDEGVRLRVVEAPLADVDKGFARVDPYHLTRLGVRAGMAITITGDRQTVAIAQAAPNRVQGRPEIQIDGMVRENAGAVVGEHVAVAPVEAFPAGTVLIAPLDAGSYGAKEVAEIRSWLSGRAVVYGDRLKVTAFSKRGHLFKVAGTEPEGAVVIGPFTDIRIKADRAAPLIEGPSFKVKYEDIGGLEDELLRVRELVELPLKYPELFARLNIEPPKGVLLYGPPGSGKTLIARAVASEVKAHFIHVNGPEIIHKFYGESEAKLREIFEEAQRRAPTVIFLDELDAIAPKRYDVSGEVEKRVVAQLLASMDGLVSRGEVVVIAATNLPEAVDPALRRPGRFDREIAVSVPSLAGRLRILQIHSRGMPLAPDVDLERLAEITHGFVGADLEALCKEAGMLAVRDCLEELDSAADDAAALEERTLIREPHFIQAFKAIEPTATREFFLEKPDVRWEDIGGIDEIRRTLLSALQLPRRAPALFEQVGLRRPTGFLLSGPSGTGKTLTAKALATESGLRLITVDPASIFSKWVGESEKALRQVFKKARQTAPCILFFDGLDALVPAPAAQQDLERATERLASQFFSELDEVVALGEVVILAATNRPERVDPALLRPGRFGFTIRFVLPDGRQRGEILAVHLRHVALDADVELAELAREMEGLSGAEIADVSQRALLAEAERFVERHGEEADREAAAGGFRLTRRALEQAIDERRRRGAEEERDADLPAL